MKKFIILLAIFALASYAWADGGSATCGVTFTVAKYASVSIGSSNQTSSTTTYGGGSWTYTGDGTVTVSLVANTTVTGTGVSFDNAAWTSGYGGGALTDGELIPWAFSYVNGYEPAGWFWTCNMTLTYTY